jgi:hypothetical protein
MKYAIWCVVLGLSSLVLNTCYSECPDGCPSDQLLCGHMCTCILTDDDNCGACDNPCGERERCVGGVCECKPGYTYCDGECVNTNFNDKHCGVCGNSCVCSCVNGACGSCPPPFLDCDCKCIDPTEDPNNCGSCFNKCSEGQFCLDGKCQVVESCADQGMENCDGYCVDTQTDPDNCGECDHSCNGMDCVDGWCV